jgi:WD40 repeat protein
MSSSGGQGILYSGGNGVISAWNMNPKDKKQDVKVEFYRNKSSGHSDTHDDTHKIADEITTHMRSKEVKSAVPVKERIDFVSENKKTAATVQKKFHNEAEPGYPGKPFWFTKNETLHTYAYKKQGDEIVESFRPSNDITMPSIRITPDYLSRPLNRRSLAISSGGTTAAISASVGKPDALIPAHTDLITDMLILKNLDTLMTCSLDKSIVHWDTTTQTPLIIYNGHRTGVYSLSYTPAYRLLVSAGFDHDALVWSPFVEGLVYRLKGHQHTLVGCHAVEDKPELVTADASGTFKLWDVRNFNCVQTW